MEINQKSDQESSETVPVLPLRDVVVYPHMVIPLFVGRDKSIEALDVAMRDNKQILLVAQKDAEVDDPGFDGMHTVGTLSNILQLLKLPDGTVKVLVEGAERCVVERFVESDGFYSAEIAVMEDQVEQGENEMEVLVRTAITMFEQYVKLNKKIPGSAEFPCWYR